MFRADSAPSRTACLRMAAVACGMLFAGAASAGILFDKAPEDLREIDAPPPPAYSIDRTLEVQMPAAGAISVGVDPRTIRVDSDGVVRYVAVARSTTSDAVTAMYEGIRCSTAEVKLYARHYADGEWRPVKEPVWKSLYDGGQSRYSLAIATSGVCQDAAPNGSPAKIAAELKGGSPLYKMP